MGVCGGVVVWWGWRKEKQVEWRACVGSKLPVATCLDKLGGDYRETRASLFRSTVRYDKVLGEACHRLCKWQFGRNDKWDTITFRHSNEQGVLMRACMGLGAGPVLTYHTVWESGLLFQPAPQGYMTW
jgi:hypothetical protein